MGGSPSKNLSKSTSKDRISDEPEQDNAGKTSDDHPAARSTRPTRPTRPTSPSVYGTLKRKLTLRAPKKVEQLKHEDDNEEVTTDDITEEERMYLEAAMSNKELKDAHSSLVEDVRMSVKLSSEEVQKAVGMSIVPKAESPKIVSEATLNGPSEQEREDLIYSPRAKKISDLEAENLALKRKIQDLQVVLQQTKSPPVAVASPPVAASPGFHEQLAKEEKERREAELLQLKTRKACAAYEENPFKPGTCRACKQTKAGHETQSDATLQEKSDERKFLDSPDEKGKLYKGNS